MREPRRHKPAKAITNGRWEFACDSYGKVRHSKMACVYTKAKNENGEYLVTVAARIKNWDDAKLIAVAPELLTALFNLTCEVKATVSMSEHAIKDSAGNTNFACLVNRLQQAEILVKELRGDDSNIGH